MALTASRTTMLLRSASVVAASTTLLASAEPSAVRRTVPVIWSSAAADSSRLAACCSVRRDMSSADWEISSALARMPRMLDLIAPMASCSWSIAALKSSRSLA